MALLTEVSKQLQTLNMHHAAQALPEVIEKVNHEELSLLAAINTLLGKEQGASINEEVKIIQIKIFSS